MRGLPLLFSAGYRIFFLTAGMFAILAMIVWEVWLGVHYAGGMITSMPFSVAPHAWHSHEMIFGYGSLAVAGFLLTAAPNWTGTSAGGRLFFTSLFTIWLAGRLAIWWSGSLPPMVVAIADLTFLPVLMIKILMMLLKRPKGPQMILLAVLTLFWMSNLLMHLDWIGLTGTATDGVRAGLFSLSALITVLGGRVTPAFTRNAMMRAQYTGKMPANPMQLAAISIAAAIVVPLSIIAQMPSMVTGIAAILAGLLALIRLSTWRGDWTLNQPILWTLHLSYAANALGFVTFGLSAFGTGSEIAALHVAGIGGIGGMTISVMSRAALGHSGRALVAPAPVATAYILIPVAMLLRYVASTWDAFYFPGILASGAAWILAFTVFIYGMWPAFLTAPDRKQGETT